MSVINKMLRDLDARQASGAAPAPSQASGRGVMHGTASVRGAAERSRASLTLRWLAGLLVLAAAGAAAWYFNGAPILKGRLDQAASPPPAAMPVLAPPVAAASAVAGPESVQPITTTTTTQEKAAEPATTSVPVPTTPVQALPSGLPEMPASRAGAVAAPARHSLRMDNTLRRAPVATTSAVAVPAPSLAAQRQAAAQETLAQAQSLWNAGSREVAREMMREAVAVAERAHSAGALPAGSQVLAVLVRELVRMELAEGRAGQVLELLTRLEPALSGQADLWAVRGNAAQRLGRHQESANAYLMALKLRPNEPRWMLGAAVSLAAQGQPADAAEWAEKARAAGVVSHEITAYLRQLGVPLRER